MTDSGPAGGGGGEAVPGAAAAATDSAPSDNAEAQAEELGTGERVYSEQEAPDFKQWKHKIQTRGGDEYEVDYDELVSGHLRQKDYTQKSQANAKDRKQYENTTKQTQALLGKLRQSDGLIQFLHEAGFPIAEALDQFNASVHAESQLTPEEQHQNQMTRQQEQHARQLEQYKQREQAQAHQRDMASWTTDLKTWIPGALKGANLPVDAEHHGMLMQELRPLLEQERRPATQQDFVNAAASIQRRWEASVKRRGYTQAPKKQAPPSPRPQESYRPKTMKEKAAGNENSYKTFQEKLAKMRRGY